MEEKLELKELERSKSIQIRVSPPNTVHREIITMFFTNPRSFDVKTTEEELRFEEIKDKGVYILPYKDHSGK